MAFCFAFTGPLRENNALELAGQRARYIDYKHELCNKKGLTNVCKIGMRLFESFEAPRKYFFINSFFFSGALCSEIDWITMDIEGIFFNTTTLTTG